MSFTRFSKYIKYSWSTECDRLYCLLQSSDNCSTAVREAAEADAVDDIADLTIYVINRSVCHSDHHQVGCNLSSLLFFRLIGEKKKKEKEVVMIVCVLAHLMRLPEYLS